LGSDSLKMATVHESFVFNGVRLLENGYGS
jgi:hypothetical protein